jgi:hypothetical protein
MSVFAFGALEFREEKRGGRTMKCVPSVASPPGAYQFD